MKSSPSEKLLFLFAFSLPFSDQISTLFLIVFLTYSIFAYRSMKVSWYAMALIAPLFLIRIIGLITGDFDTALDEIVRALPLVIVPYIISANIKGDSSVRVMEMVHWGLIIGLLVLYIYCNGFIVSSIVKNGEGLMDVFRWKYMNQNFTKPADVHPPYVGMLLVSTLVLTLLRENIQGVGKFGVIVFLFLFSIQLLPRNAMVLEVIVTSFFLIKNRKWFLLGIGGVLIGLFFTLVILHPSDYLRKKLITNNFTADGKKDSRVNRWVYSYHVFKEAPVWGVGPGNDDRLRMNEYKEAGDMAAFSQNYNSHNQFIEYLCTYGIIGILVFSAFIFMMLRQAYYEKNLVGFVLVLTFCFACMTESILERSFGIKYFALLSSVIFLSNFKENEINIFNGSRA